MMRSTLQKLLKSMRLKESSIFSLINFLLGVAWAFVFIGSLSTFLAFIKTSFFLAILSIIIGAIPGLFLVLFLEYFILKFKSMDELKKQTELLKKISESAK